MSDKKQSLEVVGVFCLNSIEGPILSGINTVNSSKQPGCKLELHPVGVLVEYKGARVLVPFSNIKSIILK